jgi:two-component system heavy metal sensor histidine kinase CusS
VKIESEVDGMAQLTITNSSQMIAPDQLAHLFDRFYRVDGARANSGESWPGPGN